MKSIELFAGIGGIALAAEWAGIETLAFCERDPFCHMVLNKNFPGIPIFEDVCTFSRQVLEEEGVIKKGGTVDIISGGFPCQPFSSAGKKKGKNDNRDLWPEMFRIVQELKPNWVVGENVANFANMELERTCSDLENEGYETQSFIIPACGVDAKHRRYRTFIVAHSNSSWELQQKRSVKKLRGRFGNSGEERKSEWKIEPRVGRVADGVSNRVDRLRCLGNAVVPQQIYPIFKAIIEIESKRGE